MNGHVLTVNCLCRRHGRWRENKRRNTFVPELNNNFDKAVCTMLQCGPGSSVGIATAVCTMLQCGSGSSVGIETAVCNMLQFVLCYNVGQVAQSV